MPHAPGRNGLSFCVITRDTASYEAFFRKHLSQVASVQFTNSSMAISEVKSTTELPLSLLLVIPKSALIAFVKFSCILSFSPRGRRNPERSPLTWMRGRSSLPLHPHPLADAALSCKLAKASLLGEGGVRGSYADLLPKLIKRLGG